MKSFQSQQFFPIAVICITLCFAATVQAREQDPTMPEDPLPFVEGSFTLVALPDTQGYSEDFPASFDAQTEWIVANAKTRNIAFVVHLGDITDDNQPEQWAVAQHALQKLDGVVPYSLCLGNHDLGEKGQTATRDSLLREYFPLDKYQALPGFGGVFDQEPDRLDNSFHLFSAGGRDFIVLALEFAPRDAVVEWANRVLGQYPDRWAILTTHGYLYSDDTRYDWAAKGSKQMWNPHAYKAAKEPGQGNDGEELWQKLVSKHPKMLMVINGHVLNDGLGRLTSQGAAGNPVHQMLVNFQMKQHLGDGFLRLIEFLPDGETVQVKDYSPVVNAYKSGEDNHFVLKIPPVKQ